MGAYVPACGAFGIDPPSVIWLGTAGSRDEKYGVDGIAKGKKCFVAISEASGGSDPARKIQTRAVRDGDDYLINGTKMWITAAEAADWGIVFARTGDPDAGGGITAFIVDRDTPGITTSEIGVIRSYSPYEVRFEDVRVPSANRLGDEGQGFAICQKWLVHARVPYAAGVIGVAQEALSHAIDWARQRHVHKSLLADKQAVQWMIADSEIELRAARLLTWQAAWNGDLGKGHQDRCLHRQGLRDRSSGPRHRPLCADPGRHGCRQGDALGTLVPRAADQARRRGTVGGSTHGLGTRAAAGLSHGDRF